MSLISPQSITIRKYPAELTLTTLVCLMGAVEGTALTLAMERDMNVWKIGWDSRLLAVTYSVCSVKLNSDQPQLCIVYKILNYRFNLKT